MPPRTSCREQADHREPTGDGRRLRAVPSARAAEERPEPAERWVPVRHLDLARTEGELLRLLVRAGRLPDVAPLLAGAPSPGAGADGTRLVRLRWRPDLLLVHLDDVALLRDLVRELVQEKVQGSLSGTGSAPRSA